jgi:hypothetical protein
MASKANLKKQLEDCENKLHKATQKTAKKVKKKILKDVDKDIKKKKKKTKDKAVKSALDSILNGLNKKIDNIEKEKANTRAEKEAKDKADKEAKDKADKEAKEKAEKEAKESIIYLLELNVKRNNDLKKVKENLLNIDGEYEEAKRKLENEFKEKKEVLEAEKDDIETQFENIDIRSYKNYKDADNNKKRYFMIRGDGDDEKMAKIVYDYYTPIFETAYLLNPNIKPREIYKLSSFNMMKTNWKVPQLMLNVIRGLDIDLNKINYNDMEFVVSGATDLIREAFIKKVEAEQTKAHESFNIVKSVMDGILDKVVEKISDKEEGIVDVLENVAGYLRTQDTLSLKDQPAVYSNNHRTEMFMFSYILKNNNNDCVVEKAPTSLREIAIRTVGNKIDISKYYLDNMVKTYKRCSKNDKLLIIPLDLFPPKRRKNRSGHANLLIFNPVRNEIERFEPHGLRTSISWVKNDLLEKNIINRIVKPFNKLSKTTLKFVSSEHSCPTGFKGFQDYEGRALKTSRDLGNEVIIKDPGGYCVSWSMFYLDLRLKFPSLDSKRLKKAVYDILTTNPERLRAFIRGQHRYMEKEINKALKGNRTYRGMIKLMVKIEDLGGVNFKDWEKNVIPIKEAMDELKPYETDINSSIIEVWKNINKDDDIFEKNEKDKKEIEEIL